MSTYGVSRGIGRRHFSKRPLGSLHFWGITLLLFFVVCTATYFIVLFRSRLNGEAFVFIVLPVLFLGLFWFGTLRAHQSASEACERLGDDGRSALTEPSVEVLLDRLAYVSYAGLAFASAAVVCAYLALGESLVHVLPR